jgi:sorting nexin-3/12
MDFTRNQSLENDINSQSKNNSIIVEISDPQTHGVGQKRYTDYLVKTKTTLSIFSSKELSVRRRFSDFEKLREKIEKHLKAFKIF